MRLQFITKLLERRCGIRDGETSPSIFPSSHCTPAPADVQIKYGDVVDRGDEDVAVYDNGNVDEGDVMDDVGEVTGEGNNDEPSSTATSPTSPTSSSPQSTSISATSTTATATSTLRSTTTVARRLQRRRRDRRERRGTVVDDSDGALVGTMECAETPSAFSGCVS